MGTMMEFNASKIDQLGLTDDISEGELDLLAGQIGAVENLLPIVKGDMYLKKCAYLGIKPFAHEEDTKSRSGSAFLKLDNFCAKLNNTVDTLQTYAKISADWQRADRMAGISLAHYREVAVVLSADKEKAISILQDAQIGRQLPDGEWERPHGKRWVRQQVKIWQGDAKATISAAVDDANEKVVNSVIPEVSKTLNTLNLSKAKQATIEKKIERAIVKETKTLQDEFSAAVDAQVDTMLSAEKKKLRKLTSEAAQDRNWSRRIKEGISTTITEQEFKQLRQFCHPDKNPGKEEQARKVYDIAVKIGEKLGFVK